jgi:hypothetical protein
LHVLLSKDVELLLVLKLVPTIMITAKNVFDIRPENIALGTRALKLVSDVVKIKSIGDNVPKEEALEQLENIFEYCLLMCAKHPRVDFQKHLASLCTWTMFIAKKIDADADFHVSRISAAIKDFFTKSSTHFSSEVFIKIMSHDQGLAKTILNIVEPYVKDESIRLFVRTSGLSIYLAALKIILKTDSSNNPDESDFLDILDKHLDLQSKVKPYFINELVQIIAEIRSSKGEIELDQESDLAVKLASIDKAIRKKLTKPTIKSLNKLVKISKAPKRSLDPKSDEHETSADEVVAKKRKKKAIL